VKAATTAITTPHNTQATAAKINKKTKHKHTEGREIEESEKRVLYNRSGDPKEQRSRQNKSQREKKNDAETSAKFGRVENKSTWNQFG
jgi:hypothetical protein